MVKTKQNLVGMKFGRLTVVSQSEDFIDCGRKIAGWNVFCECNSDKIFPVRQKDLKSGHTKSCGCVILEHCRKNLQKINDTGIKRKFNNYDLTGSFGIGYTTKGEEFYFDLEDYDLIKNYNWHIDKSGYVVANSGDNHPIRMHRLILGLTDRDIIVDHIYHVKHDNRKSQIRICTNTENCRNASLSKNNSSGVTGVHFDNEKQKWAATIKVNRKTIFLGRFNTIEEATICRKKAQDKYFGDFSFKTNLNETNNSCTENEDNQRTYNGRSR